MNIRLPVSEFLVKAQKAPILDVRSPGEFQQGHIPGAISFPLFTDEERAEIGTIYKQVSPEEAVKRGLELVEPKMKKMYDEGLSLARENTLLVHCWRGGKRSESVAWMLSLSGKTVYVLEGGYKAYRNFVLTEMNKQRVLNIVGGLTGTGKTEILHALEKRGARTVDLEGIANHRGSAFGRLGMTHWVTQTQYENELARAFSALGNEEPVWVEDESRGIGKLVHPQGYWESHCAGKLFFVKIPRAVRVERLVNDYGHFNPEEIRDSVLRIAKRLGGLVTRQILEGIERNDPQKVADLMLDYYDRNYMHLVNERNAENIIELEFDRFDKEEICEVLEQKSADIAK